MLETAANDRKPGMTSDQAPKEDATLHEIVIVGGGELREAPCNDDDWGPVQ
jgi:hypothetical protein